MQLSFEGTNKILSLSAKSLVFEREVSCLRETGRQQDAPSRHPNNNE